MKEDTDNLVKRGDVWYCRWTVNGQVRQMSTKCRTLREARARRDEILAPFRLKSEAERIAALQTLQARKEAEATAAGSDGIPVSRAWQAYMAKEPDTGASTLEQYKFQFSRFAGWITGRHKDVTLREVTDSIAADYAKDLRSAVGRGTYEKHLRLLQKVFEVLAPDAGLVSNPWRKQNTGIPRFRNIRQEKRRDLSVEEVTRLINLAEGELKMLLCIGARTGLRLGDAALLQWHEVDLAKELIVKIPSKTARRAPDEKVRIPILTDLRDMLSEIPGHARSGYVLPGLAEAYRRKIDQVTDKIQAHFRRCGIETHKAGTGPQRDEKGKIVPGVKRAVVIVGFHSLRHFFVTQCVERGVPLNVLKGMVGHLSGSITERYMHRSDAALQAAARIMTLTAPPAAAALPPASPEWRERVRALAEGLTPATAEATKAALLALASD